MFNQWQSSPLGGLKQAVLLAAGAPAKVNDATGWLGDPTSKLDDFRAKVNDLTRHR